MTQQYSFPFYDEYLLPRWDQMKVEDVLPPINRSELAIRITTMSRSMDDAKSECFGGFHYSDHVTFQTSFRQDHASPTGLFHQKY